MKNYVSQEDLKTFAKTVCNVLQNPKDPKILEYKWPDDNTPSFIKEKINFSLSLDEKKTLELRRVVHSSWNEISEDQKLVLLGWLIRDWGGIQNIHDETLITCIKHESCLGSESPESESAKKYFFGNFKNISSKSKCLAFMYPNKYFIYDSRVAIALIKILSKYHPKSSWTFHLPRDRGGDYDNFKKDPELKSTIECRTKVTYLQYCELVKMISEFLGEEESQLIEMKLFMLGKHLKKIHIPNQNNDSLC